jgi:hypothetical protein
MFHEPKQVVTPADFNGHQSASRMVPREVNMALHMNLTRFANHVEQLGPEPLKAQHF